MYTRVVVPLDGSEFAERALPHAVYLATKCGVPVHVIRVIDLVQAERFGPFGFGLEQATISGGIAEATATSETYLAALETALIAQGVHVTEEIRRGAAGEEILAAVGPGDVIVMASHGRGGLSRWYLGSVAEHVLRHASNPVLVVREQAPQTAPGGVVRTAEAR